MKTRIGAIVLTCLAAMSSNTRADIMATSPSAVVQPLPAVLTLGNTEADNHVTVFEENQALTLDASLHLDLMAPFSWQASIVESSPPAVSGGELAPGSVVASHLVHLDSVGSQVVRIDGTLRFSEVILGALVLPQSLDTTDVLLGVPGTIYATGQQFRGLDNGDAGTVTLIDPYTITFTLIGGPYIDEFRVLTAAPEPAGALLLVAGLGMGLVRRRGSARR